jgi:enamine deaminase RidA (YjgF/YER057c/UK114 family)
MTRHASQPPDVATPKAPYSPVVVSGDHVYTAGQVGIDASGEADLGDFEAYNGVYREFFAAPFPARTTVQAGLPAGLLVEIEAVARRPA